jgi:hypothetical protein
VSRTRPDPGQLPPAPRRLERLARPLGRLGLAIFALVVLIEIFLAVATGSLTIQTAIQIVSARAAVREALADRRTLQHGTRRRRTRGD